MVVPAKGSLEIWDFFGIWILDFGVWTLELLWSLELGIWSFPGSRNLRYRFSRGSMVHYFLFFEQDAYALEALHFVGGVEQDAIGIEFQMSEAAMAYFPANLGFVRAVDLLHVENDLVDFQGIVVGFSQLNLPGANVRQVGLWVLAVQEPVQIPGGDPGCRPQVP